MYRLVCHECKRVYPADTPAFRCGCGGLFDLADDGQRVDLTRPYDGQGLWRFGPALPFRDAADQELVRAISLGEGMTPLIPWGPESRLWLKADYYLPTLSFKDRGAVMLAVAARKAGQKEVLIDSSGNAGCALAAYAARAGLVCHVFLPDNVAKSKLRQVESYGALLHPIPGGRSAVSAAALEMAGTGQCYYASHVYNPLFYEGTKTYFFEVFIQLGLTMPELFLLPVGNGTLLLGAYRAFRQLREAGYISAWPRVVMVQAAACSPLARAFAAGQAVPAPAEAAATVAEGIAIPAPPRGAQILEALRDMGGETVTVGDEEILSARSALALNGMYVEKTSAASFAAYRKLLRQQPELEECNAVLPLCGAGLKSD